MLACPPAAPMPAVREDNDWLPEESVSEVTGGIGLLVTTCVTAFEKNFSSR